MCDAAQPGHYAAGSGALSEAECPAGHYADTTGNAHCELAPEGDYAEGTGTIFPAQCVAGTYNPTTGAETDGACLTTPAGTYSAAGASSPTPCPAGTESGEGASACTVVKSREDEHTATEQPSDTKTAETEKPLAGETTTAAATAATSPAPASHAEPPVRLSGVSLGRRCLAPAALGASPIPSLVAKLHVSYELNETATLSFAVARRRGSPAWTYCPTHQSSASWSKQPGEYETVWSATHGAKASARALAAEAAAAVATNRLTPGTYVLTVRAVNAEGKSSVATVKFWVVQPRPRGQR
jgi:hypothetical protein